jgi:ribulose 1,5-bisphosphate synthetase/thiazole synthase
MPDYSDSLANSDLDALKNSGAILTASFNFGGGVGGGSEMRRSTQVTLPASDFNQIYFSSSTKHPGVYKNLILEGGLTMALETTFGSELGIFIDITVADNIITISGIIFNPYSSAVNIQSTTVDFRFIPYEATF